jgi:putative phosphoesterase
MLIGIISDTHDNARNLLKAVELFNEKKVELVIHCGDWVSPSMPPFTKNLKCKIISVFGNNEGDKFQFLKYENVKELRIEFNNICFEKDIDGRKITAYHGQSEILLNGLIDSQKYDVVFSGHNHRALIEKKGKTLHVNPGSTSGVCGIELSDEITVAVYDTKTNTAEIISL